MTRTAAEEKEWNIFRKEFEKLCHHNEKKSLAYIEYLVIWLFIKES